GGEDIGGLSIRQLRQLKVSHIPEDRMTVGMAGSLSITENAIADKVDESRFINRVGMLQYHAIRDYGADMVKRYAILCKTPDVPIASLSGGNIQKVVLARELSSAPEIVIADQPTRGVDVGATEFIRKELLSLRDAGKSVFLVSSDLNELLGLADRLIVLCDGKIAAYFADTSKITEDDLGRYMLGIDQQTAAEIDEVAK
ncbi:MAG: ATP-binding cassette domain-containing protein, partial [Pseudoflavonifractor sp.]